MDLPRQAGLKHQPEGLGLCSGGPGEPWESWEQGRGPFELYGGRVRGPEEAETKVQGRP